MPEMSTVEGRQRVAEARYAYYRRCQVFRKGGAQCKAPAEKGSHICYAHAGQLATAVRRGAGKAGGAGRSGGADAQAWQAGVPDGRPVHGF